MLAQSSREAAEIVEHKSECASQTGNGRTGEAARLKVYAAQVIQKQEPALIMAGQALKQEHAHNTAHGFHGVVVFSSRNVFQVQLAQGIAGNVESRQEYVIHKDCGIISAPAQEKAFAIQAQLKQGHAVLEVRNIELAKVSANGLHGAIARASLNVHQEIQEPKAAEIAELKLEYAKLMVSGVNLELVKMKENARQEQL